MPLIVYGHPASQPSRSVFWACLIAGLAFELPLSEDFTLTPGANPRGQLPCINDEGFVLAEMAAIIWYLNEKHGWQNIFPRDLAECARVHQYLHMHHTLVRLATLQLMAPHVIKPLGGMGVGSNALSMNSNSAILSAFDEQNPLQAGAEKVRRIVAFTEDNYFAQGSSFICGTAQASVADLVHYAEIGQLELANLFDFSEFPRTAAWLEAMKEVPYFQAVQAYNFALGDIATSANTPERFAAASTAGFEALLDTGLATRSSGA